MSTRDNLFRPLFRFGTYPQNINGKSIPIEWIVVAHEVDSIRRYVTTDENLARTRPNQYALAQKEYTRGRVLLLSSLILDCFWYDTKDRFDASRSGDTDTPYPGFRGILDSKYGGNDYINYYDDNKDLCRKVWKESDMFKFLNNKVHNRHNAFENNQGFLYNAFSESERNALHDSDEGKVFLLSVEEAKMAFEAKASAKWGYYDKIVDHKGGDSWGLNQKNGDSWGLNQKSGDSWGYNQKALAWGTDFAKSTDKQIGGVDFRLHFRDNGTGDQYTWKSLDKSWNTYPANSETGYYNFKDQSINDTVNGCSWYYLRSPGASCGFAAVVRSNGDIDAGGNLVHVCTGGVRPAIWLNL